MYTKPIQQYSDLLDVVRDFRNDSDMNLTLCVQLPISKESKAKWVMPYTGHRNRIDDIDYLVENYYNGLFPVLSANDIETFLRENRIKYSKDRELLKALSDYIADHILEVHGSEKLEPYVTAGKQSQAVKGVYRERVNQGIFNEYVPEGN